MSKDIIIEVKSALGVEVGIFIDGMLVYRIEIHIVKGRNVCGSIRVARSGTVYYSGEKSLANEGKTVYKEGRMSIKDNENRGEKGVYDSRLSGILSFMSS